MYTFETAQFGEDTARLVVTEIQEDEGLYMLGISSEREAQRHAVVNHNPFGRVNRFLVCVREWRASTGVQFPMGGRRGVEVYPSSEYWAVETTGSYRGMPVVEATSSYGHTMEYRFDGSHGFLDYFEWKDQEGNLLFRMSLTSTGNDYTGEVWFIRATDQRQIIRRANRW